MRSQLLFQALAMGLNPGAIQHLFSRLHFATQPLSKLDSAWVTQLLAGWPTPRRLMRASLAPAGGQAARQGRADAAAAAAPVELESVGEGRVHGSPSRRLQLLQHSHQQPQHAEQLQQQLQRQLQQGPLLAVSRLDASYGWIPWPLPAAATRLEYAGQGCDWQPTPQLRGTVALITLLSFPAATASTPGAGAAMPMLAAVAAAPARHTAKGEEHTAAHSGRGSASTSSSGQAAAPLQDTTECSWAEMITRAEGAGALAVVFAAPPGSDVAEVACASDAECAVLVAIPVTMVPAAAGWQLRQALLSGEALEVEFVEEAGPGLYAGIDDGGRLVELGWQVGARNTWVATHVWTKHVGS